MSKRFIAQKTFRECQDWASLFEDPTPNFQHASSRPSTGVIFPDLSRPSSTCDKDAHNLDATRKPFVPPSTPLHVKAGDLGDPAMETLRQQWSWRFTSQKAMIECSNCKCAVSFKLLEGHLRLCKKGPQRKPDSISESSIRHDSAYVPPNQKKPWVGPLDDDPSIATRRQGRIRILSSGPGQGFIYEEYSIPFSDPAPHRFRGAFSTDSSQHSIPRNARDFGDGPQPRSKSDGPGRDRVSAARDPCRAAHDSSGAAAEQQRRACLAYEAAYKSFETAARSRQASLPLHAPAWRTRARARRRRPEPG